MSTTWNLTREQLADKALQKVGALARGRTANQDDRQLCFDALDGILKELPVFGYAWPQTVSGQAALPLVAATQATNLPADYYRGAMISFIDAAGKEVPLRLVALDVWNAIEQKTLAGAYPQLGFIDRNNVLRTWPVQTTTLAGKLVYQQVIVDSSTGQPSGLSADWTLGLVYGIAHEVGDEFSCNEVQIKRWGEKWASRRTLGIMNQTFPMADRLTVNDGPSSSSSGSNPLGW